ncbi:hypothetical protein L3Q67_43965 [Saccharothrix sp. AJ9571]|nr:hypothetical protein L3Q67_43965 [Saccharothrix sp. AJ9571]
MAESPGNGPTAPADGASSGSPAAPADSDAGASATTGPAPSDSQPAAAQPADAETKDPAAGDPTAKEQGPTDPAAKDTGTTEPNEDPARAQDGGRTDGRDGAAGNDDPARTADPGQQPPDEPGSAGAQPAAPEGKTPDGDELTQRVLTGEPLPETDTGVLRTAADGLRTSGTRGQEAADEALSVAHGTGQDWRGRPGEQFGEQTTEEAERTRATGEDMIKLGDGLSRGADTVDALTRERLADIDDSRPIFDMSRTMPRGEGTFVEERVVGDLVQRGKTATEQATQQVRGAFEGWQVSPVQYERGPVETGHRLEIDTGSKKLGRNPEKPFGANKTEDQIERSKLSDPSLVRNYDAVRDASFQVDSGLRNLEIAGDDVPVRLTADVTGWRSDSSPLGGSLYTEFLDTPTPKGGRFDGRAAWGAGGSADVRADVGDTSVRARLEALAGAEGEAKLDVGSQFFGAGAGGFAGAKVSAAGFGEVGGFGAGGKAEARAGIGLDAGVTFGQKDGHWVIGGKIGAALGIGGKLEGQIVIDPAKAGQTLQDIGSAIVEGFRDPGPSIPHTTYF